MFQEPTTQSELEEKNNSSAHSVSDKNIVTAAKGGAILFAGQLLET